MRRSRRRSSPGSLTSGPARAGRSGARARRPATRSTWTASTPTATATRCWSRRTRTASPATRERGRASSRASRERAAPMASGAGPAMLEVLERVLQSRKVERPTGSYVAGLFERGEAQICRKIGEEATEVVTAALGGEGDARVVSEVADLWFHTMVLLASRGHPASPRLRGAGAAPRGEEPVMKPARALLAAVSSATGCSASRIENGVFYSSKGYQVSLPRQGWAVKPGGPAELELQRQDPAGGMLADATCDDKTARRPLTRPVAPPDLRPDGARRRGRRGERRDLHAGRAPGAARRGAGQRSTARRSGSRPW